MAIARKGSRPIEVDGVAFRWSIRGAPTYMQGAFATPMHLAVQRAGDGAHSVLHVNLVVSRPDNWTGPHQTRVTPSMVRQMVRRALDRGWRPDDSGSAFELRYAIVLNA